MPLNEDIAKYVGHFRKRLPEIAGIANSHYRKTLYVTLLDCLSRAAFPNVKGNRVRFVTFIDTCSSWSYRDRVSTPQLKLALDDSCMSSGALYADTASRLAAWSEGSILRPDSDPTINDLRALMNVSEKPCVEKARYAELLYTYRNHLVHEFREPGYGMEFSDDPSTPYYHTMSQLNTGGSSWELVFPNAFFHSLCEQSVVGIKAHLKSSEINPYDAYQFGTLWPRR